MDEVIDPSLVIYGEGDDWYLSYQYYEFCGVNNEYMEYGSFREPKINLVNYMNSPVNNPGQVNNPGPVNNPNPVYYPNQVSSNINMNIVSKGYDIQYHNKWIKSGNGNMWHSNPIEYIKISDPFNQAAGPYDDSKSYQPFANNASKALRELKDSDKRVLSPKHFTGPRGPEQYNILNQFQKHNKYDPDGKSIKIDLFLIEKT